MLIFIAIAVISILQIINYQQESDTEEDEFNELRELISSEAPPDSTDYIDAPDVSNSPKLSEDNISIITDAPTLSDTNSTSEPTQNTNISSNTKKPTQTKTSTKTEPVTLEVLKERNSDFIGWIRVPGTKIDYPVMHTPGNPDYYLRKSFSKKYSSSGTPYMEEEASLSPMSDIITIYGHHMSSGKMFADLEKFRKQKFLNNNNKIVFETLDNKYTYEIQYVFKTSVYTEGSEEEFKYWSYVNFEDENAFNTYIEGIKKTQLYDNGGNIEYGDHIIMLSTCEYTLKNGRLVVVGKLIENIEKHPKEELSPTPSSETIPTPAPSVEPSMKPSYISDAELSVGPSPTPPLELSTPLATPEPFKISEKEKLTLDNVIELSKKKDELSWNDFEIYECQDVGSGLYIWAFDIDDKYGLMIGGGSLTEKPEYINLVLKNNMKKNVDIRNPDVDKFLEENS